MTASRAAGSPSSKAVTCHRTPKIVGQPQPGFPFSLTIYKLGVWSQLRTAMLYGDDGIFIIQRPSGLKFLHCNFHRQNCIYIMKKLIVGMAAVAGVAAAALGDGTVVFSTTALPLSKVTVNSIADPSAFNLAPADGTFYYALFASATAGNVLGSTSAIVGGGGAAANSDAGYVFNDPNWTFVSYGASYGVAGKFVPTGTINSDLSTTIPITTPGALVNLVAIGWSGNLGATYSSIDTFFAGGGPADGWVGESAVATIDAGSVPGDGIVPPVNMFGDQLGQVSGLQLGEVSIVPGVTPEVTSTPEPTAIALGILGGVSLLALRRRQG